MAPVNYHLIMLKVPKSDLEQIIHDVKQRALDIDMSPIVNDFYVDLFSHLREARSKES